MSIVIFLMYVGKIYACKRGKMSEVDIKEIIKNIIWNMVGYMSFTGWIVLPVLYNVFENSDVDFYLSFVIYLLILFILSSIIEIKELIEKGYKDLEFEKKKLNNMYKIKEENLILEYNQLTRDLETEAEKIRSVYTGEKKNIINYYKNLLENLQNEKNELNSILNDKKYINYIWLLYYLIIKQV